MLKAPNAGAPPLDWALYYASLGWEVFPIQPKTKNGFYHYPEFKNPETGSEYSWQHQATKDPERIRRFWTEHPHAGIGVATGQRSGGLYVLDLDKEKPGKTKDGRRHFVDWQQAHGQTANTNTAVNSTGGGGFQVFYRCRERPKISGSAAGGGSAAIYEGYGVDTRGDGNFCVLPPSVHPTGTAYTWKQDPEKYPIQEPNSAVRTYWLGEKPAQPERSVPRERFDLPEQIPEGSRTKTLVQYAGSLVERGKGLTEAEIRALVIQANDEHCSPPLPARALDREVLRSIRKFKARLAAKDFEDAPDSQPAGDLQPEMDPEIYAQRSAAARIDTFWTDAENRTPPIPTGFPQLDEFLDGGLYPGLYVIGAVSSLGKTTFALQIADQLALSGQDVLFMSLEMSATELISKSLSRLTAELAAGDLSMPVYEAVEQEKLGVAKTARALTDPTRFRHFNNDESELVNNSAKYYKSFASRVWIDEGTARHGMTVDYIRSAVERHIKITGRRPVVFVDYLQNLDSPDNRLTDKQKTDQNVRDLRDIARRNGCPLIAISSLNRENYSASISMAAFKESGAIEYSSDVLIGLQAAGMKEGASKEEERDNRSNINKVKSLIVRPLELVILKQRTGVTGRAVAYKYTPAFNCFEEAGESLDREIARDAKRKKSQAAAEAKKARETKLDKILACVELIAGNPFLDLEKKGPLDDF